MIQPSTIVWLLCVAIGIAMAVPYFKYRSKTEFEKILIDSHRRRNMPLPHPPRHAKFPYFRALMALLGLFLVIFSTFERFAD
jgi:hypothetical protein